MALSEGNQETNLGLDCFHQKLRKLELIVRKLELIVRFEKFVEGGMGQEQKVYVIFRFSKNQGGAPGPSLSQMLRHRLSCLSRATKIKIGWGFILMKRAGEELNFRIAISLVRRSLKRLVLFLTRKTVHIMDKCP